MIYTNVHTSRRAFIKGSAAFAAMSAVPYIPLEAHELEDLVPAIDTPELKALANTALDAARAAGAAYADVQLRFTRRERWSGIGSTYDSPSEVFVVSAGVSALFNGYWGFAGRDGLVTSQEAARLGGEATAQARYEARGLPRITELAPVSSVADGKWVTPIEIDPFTVSPDEKIDFAMGVCDYISRRRFGVTASLSFAFIKDERIFASTDGSFMSQTFYTTSGRLGVSTESYFATRRAGFNVPDFLTSAGKGWEYIRMVPYKDSAEKIVEDADRKRLLGKTVDVGRYDIVFDAQTMANILDQTVATATELDRAFGYEANTIGTSFLNDPLGMLGTFKVGSPLINITSNRSERGGAATVGWDDEGVAPQEVTLVKDGMLNDFQTTRESASWLAPYYNRTGKVVRSSGNSGKAKGSAPPTQCPSNFVLSPGRDSTASDITFEDLIADTTRGLAIVGGSTYTDYQALNGSGTGSLVYEIRNGKLTDVVKGASFLFRAPEFWRNVVALGSKKTSRSFGIERSRKAVSEFYIPGSHSVTAVPAKVTQLAVVDPMRKA